MVEKLKSKIEVGGGRMVGICTPHSQSDHWDPGNPMGPGLKAQGLEGQGPRLCTERTVTLIKDPEVKDHGDMSSPER